MKRPSLAACAALAALACSSASSPRKALLRAMVPVHAASSVDARRVAAMSSSPMSFYRATLALHLRDWRDDATSIAQTRFPVTTLRPFGIGDAHLENFGTLLGRDGRVTLEVNDLDAADRVPLLWDVHRLLVSLCVATRTSNAHDADARRAAIAVERDIVRGAALAYVRALRGDNETTASAPLLDDLVTRASAAAAQRDELRELTAMDATGRHLRRGPVDDDERLEDTRADTRDALEPLLARYRETLRPPIDAAAFAVLDVARVVGRGGATLGSPRLLVLLRGASDASDDDVLVEVKALDARASPHEAVARLLEARAALWTRPDADPYWGAAAWERCAVQLRAETAAAKSVRVSRMRGPLGTPDAMRALGRALGAHLGAIHRRTLGDARDELRALERDATGFADEQADAAQRYADRVFDDWQHFRELAGDAPPPRPQTRREEGCALFDAP